MKPKGGKKGQLNILNGILPVYRTRDMQNVSCARLSLRLRYIRRLEWSRRRHSNAASMFPRDGGHNRAYRLARNKWDRREVDGIRNKRSKLDAKGQKDPRGSLRLPSRRSRSASSILGIRWCAASPIDSHVLYQVLPVSVVPRILSTRVSLPPIDRYNISLRYRAVVAAEAVA